MRAVRKTVAFFSGVLLYCLGAGLAGVLARVGLPRPWYEALGGRNSLPVMLGEAGAIALLLALIALIWGYLTLRPTRRRHRPYVGWLLAGIGIAWAGWLIYGAFSFALKPRAYASPLQSMLLSSSAAPLFGGLNIFGVLAGAALAGRLALRRQEGLPSLRARRRNEVAAEPAAQSGDVSTLPPPAP